MAGGVEPTLAAPRLIPRDLGLYQKQHEDLLTRFGSALEELARACEKRGLVKEAVALRQLAGPVDSVQVRFEKPPRDVQPALPADLSDGDRFWRAQLHFQRREFAKDLYLLSRRTLNAGHVSYAYDLIREVLVHDPDHPAARKILGYVRNGNEWVSTFEANMLRARRVWHDQYGWIPKEHVVKYEAGERFYNNRWMSAAKETELRRDFVRSWEVRTEHYLVKTNHSLERGVQLATKLESFHELFYQLMAGFFNTPEQAKQLFEGQSTTFRGLPKPHEVHYYRTRDEYLDALRKITNQPVEITKGMYFPSNGIAFFFDDPESDDDSTLYHEATHQLMSGNRPPQAQLGTRAHFWIIEGIACYMESFRKLGDSFSVGDPNTGRLISARHQLLVDKYYVPLEEFAGMGMQAFQTDKNIRKNYSQGAALTHFFMHYENGKYRDALIEHMAQLYAPRTLRRFADTLEELTGTPYAELDAQFQKYIQQMGPLAARPKPGTAPAPSRQ